MRDFISSLKFLYQNQLIESQNQQYFQRGRKVFEEKNNH